jgi:MFS superfamily sulfate permease-like transporter
LGIAVLVFLFAFQRRFPNAPLPLIAVLLSTAAVAIFDLGDRDVFIRLYRFRPREFAIAIMTTIAVLATDILIGCDGKGQAGFVSRTRTGRVSEELSGRTHLSDSAYGDRSF